MENTLFAAARRMSHAERMSIARPYATPCEAATTGKRHSSIAEMDAWNSCVGYQNLAKSPEGKERNEKMLAGFQAARNWILLSRQGARQRRNCPTSISCDRVPISRGMYCLFPP